MGDSFHLIGIDGNVSIRDDVTKVFDRFRCKVIFLELVNPLVIKELLHNLSNVSNMIRL